jgi:hypothetical protein
VVFTSLCSVSYLLLSAHTSHLCWEWPFSFNCVWGVSKSFQTDYLEQELQMVQLSATRCSCIAILWVFLVSFATITLCVASQWVFIVVIHFIINSVWKLLDTPLYIGFCLCHWVDLQLFHMIVGATFTHYIPCHLRSLMASQLFQNFGYLFMWFPFCSGLITFDNCQGNRLRTVGGWNWTRILVSGSLWCYESIRYIPLG